MADGINESRAVNSQELMNAVGDILQSVGMPMNMEKKTLMAETITLRRETKAQKSQIQHLNTENENFRDRLLCKICMVTDVDRMLMPSGKMLCKTCVGKISGVCPFTRKRVDSVIKLYF